jgi:hypothetical protein
MAFAFTYSTLVQRVIDFSERTDDGFVNAIPTFVTLAIDRITKDAKTLGAEVYIVNPTGFIPNENVIQKPADWRNTITFNVGNGTNDNTRNQILLRSYEFCRQYWPDDSQTGLPAYYCDYGFNNWLVVPTPDQAYPYEIAYLQQFGPLDDQNQTNWLTDNAPELLFNCVMMMSKLYTKDKEDQQFWENVYRTALAALMGEDKGRITDRYSQRDKD